MRESHERRLQIAKCKLQNAKFASKPLSAFCILQFAFCNLHFCLQCCLGCLVSSASLGQQPQPPQITGIRVGLADRYKVGLWTQVEVTLRGGSEAFRGELSLIVPDGDGVPSRVVTPPDQPCQLAPGRETTVRLLCRSAASRAR